MNDAEHRARLGMLDDVLAFYVPTFYERVRDLDDGERRDLSSTCATIIATHADAFMFDSSQTPRFRLYPPDIVAEAGKPLHRWVKTEKGHLTLVEAPDAVPILYGEYTFGQVLAFGLLCAWYGTPVTAGEGEYGPARMFPSAAHAFRAVHEPFSAPRAVT